jgi:hypothetical protein
MQGNLVIHAGEVDLGEEAGGLEQVEGVLYRVVGEAPGCQVLVDDAGEVNAEPTFDVGEEGDTGLMVVDERVELVEVCSACLGYDHAVSHHALDLLLDLVLADCVDEGRDIV